MSSRNLVIALSIIGILIAATYYIYTKESSFWPSIITSVSTFLVGLALIYLVVERRINEEKRAKLNPVET